MYLVFKRIWCTCLFACRAGKWDPITSGQSVRLHAARNLNFWSYRIMTCVGPDHLSEYTCRSENRITWPEHGWLRYARWRCSPLNKEPHPVDLYLFLQQQSFWKVRVSRLSAVHKLQYIQLLHLGQHEPGLVVRPEVRRCWSHGVDWRKFSGMHRMHYPIPIR